MSEFKVTISSTRKSLYYADLVCINECCTSDSITVSCLPGSTEELTKETYVCRSCGTSWIAEMHAARIESITSPSGDFYDSTHRSTFVEKGSFQQIETPTGVIKAALEEFVTAMKIGSPTRKGEALGRLAFMARVEL